MRHWRIRASGPKFMLTWRCELCSDSEELVSSQPGWPVSPNELGHSCRVVNVPKKMTRKADHGADWATGQTEEQSAVLERFLSCHRTTGKYLSNAVGGHFQMASQFDGAHLVHRQFFSEAFSWMDGVSVAYQNSLVLCDNFYSHGPAECCACYVSIPSWLRGLFHMRKRDRSCFQFPKGKDTSKKTFSFYFSLRTSC